MRKNDVNSILLAAFVFIFASVFALFNMNAEGEGGWAGNLSAWRPNSNLWWVKILSWIPLLGREVNGFVLFAITFFIMAFLFIPFWNWVHGKLWDLRDWGELICFFAIFAVLEDFLWFVINPYYGLERFSAQFISWHPIWLGPLPADYYLGLIISIGFGIWARGWKWYGMVITTIFLLLLMVIGIGGL